MTTQPKLSPKLSNISEKGHPFHMVEPSVWPIVTALSAFVLAYGGVDIMHKSEPIAFYVGLLMVVASVFFWWRDVARESDTPGIHSPEVQRGLRVGMVLFILSEIMFFVTFFWAYFHSAVNPTESIGGVWPPKGLVTFDPFHLPYFNTLILLTSGTTVTWAHHALLEGDRKGVLQGLGLTILLGVSFTTIQVIEYSHAAFALKDGIYPSTFFLATGFHGLHVIIGTLFLSVCWVRAWYNRFTPKAHVGFEAAAWYWHFVDVVWLFLFVSIYWWGYRPILS
jgi:cytochrome c oxidase subunit 3